ncbi:T9SS type A sorting domain-containing protein, partial [candidate division KSB1 bacterium]|nr:T9SS type A sorting domain-containing protein [candidate division KSB1 bacterium]
AGSDYVAKSGIVTFPVGSTTQTITVVVNGDAVNEPDETFFVNLSGAVNATIVDTQGQGTITGTTAVSEAEKVIPTEFSLNQNYPNPFNPSTTILYALPKTAFVRLTVINPLGNEVETLVSATQVAGEYEINWNPKNLASGVYLYRIQAGEFVETRKMVLMR